MRSFRDRTVLVTGAALGLGRALCHVLAARGARVAALDLQAEPLEATLAELREAGRVAAGEVADVTDRDAVARAVAALEGPLGTIDSVIANAGITHRRPFGPGEAPAFRRVLEVNVLGAVYTVEAVFDSVVRNGGVFIAISSVAGFAPLIRRTGYAASKHAVEGFFGSLRSELHGSGAEVMIVRPAFIATHIRQSSDGPSDDSIGPMMTAEWVAERIVRGAERGRQTLHIGRIAWLSSWLVRLSPGLYERLMRRNFPED